MITVEELISVVHRYTDPIRITVVMGDARFNYNANFRNVINDFRLNFF